MKAKSFKKFFASIALSAVLTFSTAATAFAATAQLMPVEQSAELSQEQTDTPSVDDSDAQATGASYLTSQAGIAQIAASEKFCDCPVDSGLQNAAKIRNQYQSFQFWFLQTAWLL